MTTTNLSIFPSPSKTRNLDLSKPRLSNFTRASAELKGFALRLGTSSDVTEIRDASDGIHSVWSASTTSPPPNALTFKDKITKRHLRKRSSTPGLYNAAAGEQSILPARPSTATRRSEDNTKVISPVSTASRTTRASIAITTSPTSMYSSDTPHTSLSSTCPPSSKDHIRPSMPKINTVFPQRLQSLPTCTPSNVIPAHHNETPPAEKATLPAPPPRSIFPEYDSDRRLSQQKYYPQRTVASQPASILKQRSIERTNTPPYSLDRKDSAVVLDESYTSTPQPASEDIAALWAASTRLGACAGRKVQLPFHRKTGTKTAFQIEQSGKSFFSLSMQEGSTKDDVKHLSIEKTDPQTDFAQLLANISLPAPTRSQASYETDTTSIFPHQAAIDALTAASNSPQAADIARFDPRATSRAAELLAQEAVNDAHRCYTSEVVRTIRRSTTASTSRASYRLRHPVVGEMPISVGESASRNAAYLSSRDRRMQVSLHHPSALISGAKDENVCLISVDFAANSCVVDLPAILAMDAEYMLDTAIAAIFATAAMESSDGVEQEVMTFAAPPTIALSDPKKHRGARKSGKKGSGRKGNPFGLKKTGMPDVDDQVERMPAVAQGTLAVVELGIHGAFYLLEKGCKAIDGATAMRENRMIIH